MSDLIPLAELLAEIDREIKRVPACAATLQRARSIALTIPTIDAEPEVVESEWVNIKPCTNDAVEYADFIAYLARTEMGMASWECKNCGSIDMGAPTRKPCHCRGCGATMRNGDFDKSEMNIGARMDAPERAGKDGRDG